VKSENTYLLHEKDNIRESLIQLENEHDNLNKNYEKIRKELFEKNDLVIFNFKIIINFFNN
jgi:hypothetical protein